METITFKKTVSMTITYEMFKQMFNIWGDEQYEETWKQLVKAQDETKYGEIQTECYTRNETDIEKFESDCGTLTDFIVCKVNNARDEAIHELNKKYQEELKKIMTPKRKLRIAKT